MLKVTIIGAAGKIGKSLSLMLKQSPLIDELCLQDLRPTTGLAMELNHIDTNCKVTAFTGDNELGPALNNAKVVVIVAAVPGTETQNFDSMWQSNAPIIREIVTNVAKFCPKAFLALHSNPINSMVPMAAEVMKKSGCFNPNTLFGITSIDTIRTNTFVAQVQGLEPECVTVPVIGGTSEETLVPVLSQAVPCADFTNEELELITHSVKKAHLKLSSLLGPADGAPLSSAFAAARFVLTLVKALHGFAGIVDCAFVASNVYPHTKYFASPMQIGVNGIAKNLGIPKLSDYEQCLLDNSIEHLMNDAKRGEKYVGVIDPAPCNPCNVNLSAPRCPQDFCTHKGLTGE